MVFAVNLDGLYALSGETISYTPPPRFPSVESHVNVVAPAQLEATQLLARIQGEHLVRRTVRDVWTGSGVPEGSRRLTLELEFNHPDRSLTHQEVGMALAAIKQSLESGGELTVEISA